MAADNGRRPSRFPLLAGLLVDALLLHSVTLATFHLRFSGNVEPYNLDAYLGVSLPATIIILLSAYFNELYTIEANLTHLDILWRSAKAVSFGYLAVVTFIFYSRAFAFPRTVILLAWIASIVALALWRQAAKTLAALQRPPTRTLILGTGEEARAIGRDFAAFAPGEQVIDGYMPTIEARDFDMLLAALTDRMRERGVGQLVIAAPELTRDQVADLVLHVADSGVRIAILPHLYEIMIGNIELKQIAGVPLLEVRFGERLPWYRAVKELLDRTAALLALLLFSPLFLLCALAIRLDGPGPVLYAQERLGQRRRPFRILKFRTMRTDAEAGSGPTLATADDPRVTRVGRLLRRLHLDELPQFLNVLAGDMSLIGPRPERAFFVERFEAQMPAYRLRHTVKPGITGLAQVHGRYDTTVGHKLRYDLVYINNMSPLLDLKILVLTLRSVLTARDRI